MRGVWEEDGITQIYALSRQRSKPGKAQTPTVTWAAIKGTFAGAGGSFGCCEEFSRPGVLQGKSPAAQDLYVCPVFL